MRCAILLATLSACTYPEKVFSEPFDCLGEPAPSSAAERMIVSGTVLDAQREAPLAGVVLDFQDRNMGQIEGPDTTTATGAFSFSLNNGGLPAERVYIRAEAPGYVTTYQANSRPLTRDVSQPFSLISDANTAALATGIGGPVLSPTTGAVFVNALDCNNKRIAGAVVSAMPAGDVHYFNGFMPSMTATATDPAGVVLITNLAAGPVTLNLTVDGMSYPAQNFTVVPNAYVQFDYTPSTPVN